MMKLKWPGFNARGNVIIDLAGDAFKLSDDAIVIDSDTFEPKDELHITVIGTELGLIVQRSINSDRAVEQLLADVFEAIDWSFTQTGPVHLLTRVKDGVVEKSLILLIDMPGLAGFYARLKDLGLISADTPLPPAHITLYTKNCAPGIGIPNNKVLNLLTVKTIPLKALDKLCN